MKAIFISSPGDASVLKMAEFPSPALGSTQVRIEAHYSGLNRADISQREGKYPSPPGESEIPGMEVSGRVLEVGKDVSDFKVGDAVMALVGGGAYAEEVVADSGLTLPIPKGLNLEQAGALPEAFLTAHHNLFHLAQAAGKASALVHAGASGVGTAGIQLLCLQGSRCFVTVGTPAKAAFCEALGASPIFYKSENFADRILKEGKGVDAILDPVGASYLKDNLRCLAVGGSLVVIGLMGGRQAEVDLAPILMRRLRIIGSTLRSLPLSEKREVVKRFRPLLPQFEGGKLKAIIDSVYSASEVAQAHRHMESNKNTGKILLRWR